MKIWLFKPFDRLTGGPALVAGLIVVMLTAILAWRSGLQTDGVFDLHFQADLSLSDLLLQGLINWLTLSVCLLIAGRWLSATRFRLIDLFGTQALARWPMLLAVIYLSIPALGGRIESLTLRMAEAMPTEPDQVMASSEYLLDAMWLTLISLPLLALLAWMIWLMFHSYAVTCKLRGMRAFFSFIAALLVAEILSKLLIHLVH